MDSTNIIPISARNVISNDCQMVEVPCGGSVHDLLIAAGVPAFGGLHIFLDDRLLVPAEYKVVYPMAGQKIFIAIVPQGGDDGKAIMRSFAMIAVMAASMAIPGLPLFAGVAGVWGGLGATAGYVTAAAVGMAGSLAVNALIPTASPDKPQAVPSAQQSYAITGTRNQQLPFDCIPKTLGRDLVFPPFAAIPWTQVQGNKQRVHMLFSLGRGRIEWEQPKFGNTLVDLSDNEIFHGTGANPPQHYGSYSVFQEQKGLLLDSDPDDSSRRGRWPTVVSTNGKAIAIELEFYSPSLSYFDKDFRWVEVGLEVKYKLKSEDDTDYRPVRIYGGLPIKSGEYYFDDNTIGKGNKAYLKGYTNTTSRWGISFFTEAIEDGGEGGEYDVSIRRFWMHIKDKTFYEDPVSKNNLLTGNQSILKDDGSDFWNANENYLETNSYYGIGSLISTTYISKDHYFYTRNLAEVTTTNRILEVRIWARAYPDRATEGIGVEIWDAVTGSASYPIFDLVDGSVSGATNYEVAMIDNGEGYYECVVRRNIPKNGNPNEVRIHLANSSGNVTYAINEYDGSGQELPQVYIPLIQIRYAFSLTADISTPVYTGAKHSEVLAHRTDILELGAGDSKGINFDNLRDEIHLTAIRTISRQAIQAPDDLNLLAVTALGTDRLSGTPDNFNLIVQGHHPVYQYEFTKDYHFENSFDGFVITGSGVGKVHQAYVNVAPDVGKYLHEDETLTPILGDDGKWQYGLGTDLEFRLVSPLGLSFDGSESTKVVIRLRQMGAPEAAVIKFQWQPLSGSFSSSNEISFSVDKVWRWQTFEFDLSTDSGWTGNTIDRIQLLFTHLLWGESYDVDYIRIQSNTTKGWTVAPTSRPPWIFAEVSTGSANHKAKALSDLNHEELESWAGVCETNDYQYNATVSNRSLSEMKRVICAVGRATPNLERDGRESVVVDGEQTKIWQVFSPRNSWGFRASKTFNPIPDAYRVNFRNVFNGYAMNELLVGNDLPTDHPDYVAGVNTRYDASNAQTFETNEYDGVVDPFHVFKLARQDFASAKLQPESFSLFADPEYMVARRGHRVQVQEDTVMWGQNSGRITSFSIGDSNYVTIELDQELLFEDGKTYACNIRTPDGENPIEAEIEHPGAGAYDSFVVQLASGYSSRIAKDQLVTFGEVAEGQTHYEDLIIIAIVPQAESCAQLYMIHYAPEKYDLETIIGEIPDFEANITEHVDRSMIPPNKPVIDRIISNETVMEANGSTLLSRMVVCLKYNDNGNTIVANRTELQYRRTEIGDAWKSEWIEAGDWKFIVKGVEEGKEYELRLRAWSAHDIPTDWVYEIHTVEGKTNPPPKVEGFAAFVSDNKYNLSWDHYDVKEVPDFLEFELRYQDVESSLFDWDSAKPLHISPDASATDAEKSRTRNNFHSDRINWNGPRTFGIKGIDQSGNYSVDPSLKSLTTSLLQVTSLKSRVFDNNVFLEWKIEQASSSVVPLDFCYIVRGGDSQADALSKVDKLKKTGTFTSITEYDVPGTFKYWVIPVSRAGVVGIGDFVEEEVNEPPGQSSVRNWAVDLNERAGVSGSNIEMENVCVDSLGIAYAPVAVGKTIQEHFEDNGFRTTQDFINAGYTKAAEPVPLSASYKEEFDMGQIYEVMKAKRYLQKEDFNQGAEVSGLIGYGASSGVWTKVGTKISDVFNFRYLLAEYQFSSNGKRFSAIDYHQLSVSSKPLEDSGYGAITDDAAGLYVTFNIDFARVNSVVLTYAGPLDDDSDQTLYGYQAVAMFDESQNNPQGFQAFIFSGLTTKKTGKFFWTAKGF